MEFLKSEKPYQEYKYFDMASLEIKLYMLAVLPAIK